VVIAFGADEQILLDLLAEERRLAPVAAHPDADRDFLRFEGRRPRLGGWAFLLVHGVGSPCRRCGLPRVDPVSVAVEGWFDPSAWPGWMFAILQGGSRKIRPGCAIVLRRCRS